MSTETDPAVTARPARLCFRSCSLAMLVLVAFATACAPITPLPGPQGPNIPGPSGLPGGTTPSVPGNSPTGSPLPGGQSPGGPSTPGSQGPSGNQSGNQNGSPSSSGRSGPGGAGSGIPGSYDTPPIGSGPSTPGGQPGGPGGMPGGTGQSGGLPRDAGNGQQPTAEGGWEDVAGTGEQQDDSWDKSNQVPGSGGQGGTAAQSATPPDEAGKGKGGDDELDEALGTFDGEILNEQSVSRSLPGGGSSPIPLPDKGEAENNTSDNEQTASAPTVPRQRSMPPAPLPPGGGRGVPDDIPDAKDDDIIARQLREAAMQEEDPVLREKLWEDYRKYKGA